MIAMKTAEEIKAKIKETKHNFAHVLTGSFATIEINAPRALEQIAAENRADRA